MTAPGQGLPAIAHPAPAALLDALPDPVLVIGRDVRLRWANRAAIERFGWTPEDLIGRDVEPLVHRDDLVTALSSLRSVQSKLLGTAVTIRLRDSSGRFGSFEVRGRSATDDRDVDGVVLVLRDLADRRAWDVDGGDEALFRAVLNHAPGITLVLRRDGTIRGASRACTTILGRDLESTLGLPLWQLAADDDAAEVRREIARSTTQLEPRAFEASFLRTDGRLPVPLSLTVVNLLDDQVVEGLVVSAVDITTLAEARARLHHNATHDPLTGLVNRSLLRDRLTAALASARADGQTVGLMFCDIDGFKPINDRFGHRAGDDVLVEVARRLLGATRETDVVSRYGGDEFVILLDGADEVVGLSAVERVRSALAAPIQLDAGAEVSVRVSVGLAVDPGTGDLDELLARADTAMYRVKAARS